MLYRTILVDTPVGKYFTLFMADLHDGAAAADADSVRATFTEIPMSLIENSIKKLYLEDFYYFARDVVGGETGAAMGELLATRADVLTINVTYNRRVGVGEVGGDSHAHTLLLPPHTPLTPPPAQLAHGLGATGGRERAGGAARPVPVLWAALPGGRGPAGHGRGRGRRAARARARVARVRRVVGCVGGARLPHGWAQGGRRAAAPRTAAGARSFTTPPPPDAAPSDARGNKDISDTFFRASVRALEGAFEGQFHYACFYAYAKLKEQEVKNIAWIATCMEHGVYGEMERIVPVFSRVAAVRTR